MMHGLNGPRSLFLALTSQRTVETPRPSNVHDAQTARRAAYDEYVRRISDAWRNPTNPNKPSAVEGFSPQYRRDGAEPDQGTRPGDLGLHRVTPEEFAAGYARRPTGTDQDPEVMRAAALRERDERLVNAWRSAAAAVERNQA
jgi:hypothetical protein